MQTKDWHENAIVLRGRPLGEADRILTFFTAGHGKLDAVAKGIRQAKSRLAGKLEFGNEVKLQLHQGKTLSIITGADILHAHWQTLVQPDVFAVATTMIELVLTLCEPELPIPELFVLLGNALRAIGKSPMPAGLIPRFELRLLTVLGLAPMLDACVHCSASLQGVRAYVNAPAGGLVCADACGTGFGLLLLSEEEVANIQALSRADQREGRVAIHALPSVARVTHSFLSEHLDRRPRSEATLRDMQRFS